MTSDLARHPASFRDPSGFLFLREGVLYRQVNQSYRDDYDLLLSSGLYDALVLDGALLPHEEVPVRAAQPDLAYKILRPELLEFVSYPYEWCFGQLKDAALLTLRIQSQALDRGMTLKDASAYNVQFQAGRPVLIDSLSFERLKPGVPWVAYRQFCQHFLAPLALMAKRDVRLGQLLRVHIDGIPLDLAARLLPWTSYLNFGLVVHLHLHASAQRRMAGRKLPTGDSARTMGQRSLEGLIDSLRRTVEGLQWAPAGSWSDYYEFHNYDDQSFAAKERMVASMLEDAAPDAVWDLGANTGHFSRIASDGGAFTVSADFDPGAVEINYQTIKESGEDRLLPLLLDLTNPSPGIGWDNSERDSLRARGPADLVMALALVHHLAIGNNVPFPELAAFIAGLAEWLLIEFVPKGDPQVQVLLRSRQDIFSDYTRESFESAFASHYRIVRVEPLPGSDRWLYLMQRPSA
ncbi:MAG: hypothetical protein WBR18_03115 [Anaerolineales bacterium]